MAIAAAAGATAMAITAAGTPWVRSRAVRLGWIKRSMEERWGRRVIARLGGVAMFVSFIGASLLWVPMAGPLAGLLLGTTLVFILGVVDDLHRLPPSTKLIFQLLISLVVVMSGIRIQLIQWAWVSIPLSVLWFVFVMNAFNLLDNMDGLAAGIGALAAGFCAFHAVIAQQWTVVSLAAIVCGACLGFLWFNFPPAKIYMGDTGSHFLGLSLAALALLGSWRHSTQLVSVLAVPAFVLAVPIFDTCFVTIQRLLHRQHPFTGGTDHVSHRLAVLGLSTRQTVVALYGVSLCLGLLSVVSLKLTALQVVVAWLLAVTGLVVFGRYLSRVRVYRLEPEPAVGAPPSAPKRVTLIETMLLHKRRLLEILVDFCLLSSVYILAHLLRFEGSLSLDLQWLVVQSLPIILVVKLTCFAGCGLYRGVWRYVGVSDIVTVFKVVTLGSIFSSLALLYLWRFEGYSRAVLIIDWLTSLFAVGGSRVAERLLDEWIGAASGRGVPVVIFGAGDTGARVLRSMRYEHPSLRRAIGLLDDDPRTWGSRIHGKPVLGGRGRLAEVLDAYRDIQEVLVAITDPPGDLLEHVRQCCEARGLTWKVVTAGITDAV